MNTFASTLPLSPGATIPVIWTSGTSTPFYSVKSALVNVAGGITTGTQLKNNSENKVRIYPNPSNDKVFIIMDESFQQSAISVLDITGQVVIRQNNLSKGCNNFTVDVSGLGSGIYFVQLRSVVGELITRKISVITK